MTDTRGLDINMESDMTRNAGILLYNPKSDFINLTKVKQVKIARKEEAIRRRESEKNWKNISSEEMDLGNCGRSNGPCNKHNGGEYEGGTKIHTKKKVFNGTGDCRNKYDLLLVPVHDNIVRKRMGGGMHGS